MRHLQKNELTLPISRPELKSEIAANTGLNCQKICAENGRLRPSWRRERNWDRTFSARANGRRVTWLIGQTAAWPEAGSNSGKIPKISICKRSLAHRHHLMLRTEPPN